MCARYPWELPGGSTRLDVVGRREGGKGGREKGNKRGAPWEEASFDKGERTRWEEAGWVRHTRDGRF